MRPRQDDGGRADARQPAGELDGLRHARRRRSRHPQSDPLRDARSGDLLLRPAPPRHGHPRPLQPADRPHAGRARRGALRRRRRPRAVPGNAADREAGRLPFRHRRGRPRRHRARLRADPRLQRHRPPDGARLDQGRRRPRREGRARPRPRRGDGGAAALPRARRQVAAEARPDLSRRGGPATSRSPCPRPEGAVSVDPAYANRDDRACGEASARKCSIPISGDEGRRRRVDRRADASRRHDARRRR